jgi:hypothetical protein
MGISQQSGTSSDYHGSVVKGDHNNYSSRSLRCSQKYQRPIRFQTIPDGNGPTGACLSPAITISKIGRKNPAVRRYSPHICLFSKPYPVAKLITIDASSCGLLSEASRASEI